MKVRESSKEKYGIGSNFPYKGISASTRILSLPKDLFRWFLFKYLHATHATNLLITCKTLYDKKLLLEIQMQGVCNEFKIAQERHFQKRREINVEKKFFEDRQHAFEKYIVCELCDAMVLEKNIKRHNEKAKKAHADTTLRNRTKKKCSDCGCIYPNRSGTPHFKIGCPLKVMSCEEFRIKFLNSHAQSVIVWKDCDFSGTLIQLDYHVAKQCNFICKTCKEDILQGPVRVSAPLSMPLSSAIFENKRPPSPIKFRVCFAYSHIINNHCYKHIREEYKRNQYILDNILQGTGAIIVCVAFYFIKKYIF